MNSAVHIIITRNHINLLVEYHFCALPNPIVCACFQSMILSCYDDLDMKRTLMNVLIFVIGKFYVKKGKINVSTKMNTFRKNPNNSRALHCMEQFVCLSYLLMNMIHMMLYWLWHEMRVMKLSCYCFNEMSKINVCCRFHGNCHLWLMVVGFYSAAKVNVIQIKQLWLWKFRLSMNILSIKANKAAFFPHHRVRWRLDSHQVNDVGLICFHDDHGCKLLKYWNIDECQSDVGNNQLKINVGQIIFRNIVSP